MTIQMNNPMTLEARLDLIVTAVRRAVQMLESGIDSAHIVDDYVECALSELTDLLEREEKVRASLALVRNEKKMLVVFNRYWVSDKSGTGREKWKYFTGEFESSHEAWEHVRGRYEGWAQDPDDYRFRVELNVVPPRGDAEVVCD